MRGKERELENGKGPGKRTEIGGTRMNGTHYLANTGTKYRAP